MMTRRLFVRDSAVVMAGIGAAPSWLARAAEGAKGKRKVLVAIFQRGAADSLNVVVPFSEKRYYELRPTIGIPAPSGAATGECQSEYRGRPGWAFCAASPVAAAEGAVGQAAVGDCGGDRLAGPDALALRRAGLYGDGLAGEDDRRRLAESRAGAGRSRYVAGAGDRDGRATAAHATWRPRGDCGQRYADVPGGKFGYGLDSGEHVLRSRPTCGWSERARMRLRR